MNTNNSNNSSKSNSKTNERLCRLWRRCRLTLLSLCAVVITCAAATDWADSVYIITDNDGGAVVLEADQEIAAPDLDSRLISVTNGSRGYDLFLEEGANVIIRHEGTTQRATSRQESVSTLLNRLNAAPGPLEAVGVKISDASVELNVASELVFYDHVREKAVYNTVRRANPDMAIGEERVVQNGANGTRTSIYEVVWSNGEEISRQFVEELASTAVDKIVEYGTGETAAKAAAAAAEAAAKAAAAEAEAAAKAAASSTPSVGKSTAKPAATAAVNSRSGIASVTENADGSGTLRLKDGTVLRYSGARKMTATAYTSGEDGVGTRTASGTRVRVGVVAVDRSVIPLGTRMYIVANGGIVYGMAVAEDTGVRGRKVDLYLNSYQECIQFGVRGCTVYILE